MTNIWSLFRYYKLIDENIIHLIWFVLNLLLKCSITEMGLFFYLKFNSSFTLATFEMLNIFMRLLAITQDSTALDFQRSSS